MARTLNSITAALWALSAVLNALMDHWGTAYICIGLAALYVTLAASRNPFPDSDLSTNTAGPRGKP